MSVRWFALSGSSREIQTLKIPDDFSGGEVQAWEELDGYPHDLDRRERFLLSLLESGELDAVVSFQVRIASDKIRPLTPDEDQLWSHYRSRSVYPINHLFVIRESILTEFPEITGALKAALRAARILWVDYLPTDERGAIEREIKRLGWDPFEYSLGDVEKRSLATFVEYLHRENKISRELSPDILISSC